MKGSIEYMMLLLISCFTLVVMVQITVVQARIHRGHTYLEYIIAMTEDYDGQLEKVAEHAEMTDAWIDCTMSHSLQGDRYEITVTLPIAIPALKYTSSIKLVGITLPIKQIGI